MSSLNPPDPLSSLPSSPHPSDSFPPLASAEHLLTPGDLRVLAQLGFDLLGETTQQFSGTHFVFVRHVATGARAVLIQNRDEHMRAEINITTLPSDNSGVFHKLEHAVATGSQGGCVYDEMVRSLLLTECNAYTGPDFTSFVASGVDPDSLFKAFRLQMDLVLAGPPSQEAYLREHGHLVPDSNNPSGFRFAGVVYEEMKGYYSSPSAWIQEAEFKAIFPSGPIHFVSGGKPREMIEMSYDQFVATYERFYTPSNISVVLYGGESFVEKARVLSESLEGRAQGSLRTDVPASMPATEPREVRDEVPADIGGHVPAGAQFRYSLAYRLPKLDSFQDKFELGVLHALLDSGECSPFAQYLRESDVPMTYQGVALIEIGHDLVMRFSFADGTNEEVVAVREAMVRGLEHFQQNGFSSEAVEAILASFESWEEEFLRSSNRGETIAAEAVLALRQGVCEVDPLSSRERGQILREKLSNGSPVFQGLLKKFKRESASLTDIVLEPKEDLLDREANAEAQQVHAIVARLSENDRQERLEVAARMANLERKSVKDIVPVATLSDRYRQARREQVEHYSFGRFPTSFHEQDLGSQCLVRFSFETSGLPAHQLQAARIASMVLSDIGIKGMEPGQFVTEALSEGATIDVDVHRGEVASVRESHLPKVRSFLSFTTKMQSRSHIRPLGLLEGIITMPELAHIPTLNRVLSEAIEGYRSSLNDPEVLIRLVLDRSYAALVPWAVDLQQDSHERILSAQSEAARRIQDAPEEIVRELEGLHQELTLRAPGFISVIGNRSAWEEIRQRLQVIAESLSADSPIHREVTSQNPGVPLVSGVIADLNNSFLAMRVPLFQDEESAWKVRGRAKVFAQLLDRELFVHIREKGGAYGAGAGYDGIGRNVMLYSAQDPNIARSFEAFRNLGGTVVRRCSEDALARAKVSVMKAFVRAMSADERGDLSVSRQVYGPSYAMEDEYRSGIMDCTLDHIREVAAQFQGAVDQRYSFCVYGNESDLRKAMRSGIPLEITPR